MIKSLIFSTILTLLFYTSCIAQKTHSDSVKKAVRLDIKNFKLVSTDLKKFRKGEMSNKSDFFKPTEGNVSDASFLKDSIYVNAYREAAYLKTKKRRTTGHHILVWGTAIVVAPIIVVWGLLAGASK